MNYWVCTAGRYRTTSILCGVNTAFFNNHQIERMIYMLDKIVLARMMPTLKLDFKKLWTTMTRDMRVTMTMDSHLKI